MVSLALAGCDDQIMEWQEKDSTVGVADLPLELKEKIALYEPIKSYVQQYHPNLNVALGMGADMYLDKEQYKSIVDENFTGVTLGNAMKFGVVCSSSGTLNYTTVDNIVKALPADMKLYGHNLLWHTQQPQAYLKSLIAPKMVVTNDGAGGGVANLLTGDSNNFNNGTFGSWASWGSNKDEGVIDATGGKDGSSCAKLTNKGDGNYWDAQFAYTFGSPLSNSDTYVIKFKAKSSTAAGKLQFQYQNSSDYSKQGGYHEFSVGTSWIDCEFEFTPTLDDANRIIINFGKVDGTYWIDDIEFGIKVDGAKGVRPLATTVTYEPKTAAEKREILLGAMESWIKDIMQHMGDRVDAWDVINEPIADGSNKWRGFDGAFGGSDNDGNADSAPTETADEGLTLNWASDSGNQHWYWGYYVGKDYGVKAFQYARQYSPNGAKLFVNDYNLETSPAKLKALIEFVNYIDQNGGHVDGIGTQMHVSSTITKEQVDAMFQTLAATGKLVRITELDVSFGKATLSAEQAATQASIYQMIIESYLANVPESQQSSVTLWTLSDNAKEHEYWLKDDAPNIFDSNYERKHAYKGVCDAIAGFDISTDFNGTDWKSIYQASDDADM